MMRLILILALFVSTNLYAQEFQPGSYDYLNYQMLSSNIGSDAKPALVIFLHGRHACGTDNKSQLKQPAVQKIAKFIIDNNIAAYLIVPQCPPEREWIAGNGNPGCDDKIMELIEQCLSEKDIDRHRVYICSTSMGSWAAWSIVSRNPNLFAAAFIASGMPKSIVAQTLTTTPIKVTVDTEERSMYKPKAFVSEIKKGGGTIDIDILLGCDHPRTCRKVYTAKRLRWLFSHTKDR